MSVVFDEYGRPFVIMREQENRDRLKGLDAQKSNILAARTVANILRSSLGPKGLDKMLVSPDGDVTITNDGATILDRMYVQHQIARLIVQLSKSQDDEIGDGTTGVVVLAGALLGQAEKLLNKGIHPVQISNGFESACSTCLKHLESISTTLETSENVLLETAKTTLSSKIVNKYRDYLAKVAVDTVLAVADLERKDVNFELIKVASKVGGTLADTKLVQGVVLDKEFSHPQMTKVLNDVKCCILTCAFEPPKPKTKHQIQIKSAKQYAELAAKEQEYFTDMIEMVKASGAQVVFCQWGFDDEANHLLYKHGLHAVRWVGGQEIELLAIATGAKIVPRFEELSPEKLGVCRVVKEESLGTAGDRVLLVNTPGGKKTNSVTLLVRGSNQMLVEEAERSIHDALCVVRNLVRDPRIVYGGGSAELSMALNLSKVAGPENEEFELERMGFAAALEDIACALAENSGLSALKAVSEVKATQVSENKSWLGIDCMGDGIDMKSQKVFETLVGKQQQLQLATQLVKMILKIDDVISPADAM
eukprot:maker-scaffold_11-snap-gene-2.32-mRNA-1 protein AED:0.01 eAED:0.01 QI:204/1/1/1/1/1/2/320/534